MRLKVCLNSYLLTTVISSCLIKMEMPKVEMGNDMGIGEKLWEGLGVEDKSEDKGKNARLDLVSDNTFNDTAC